jgi:hypothetical protein
MKRPSPCPERLHESEIFQSVRKVLRSTTAQLLADLCWLAKEWDGTLDHIEYPTRKTAMQLLSALGTAYGRGRGLRTGNPKAWERAGSIVAAIQSLMVSYVIASPGRDVWFPNTTRLFPTEDAVIGQMRQDMQEMADETY